MKRFCRWNCIVLYSWLFFMVTVAFPIISFRKTWESRFFSSVIRMISSNPKSLRMKLKRDGIGFPKGYFDEKNRYSLIHEQKSGIPEKVSSGRSYIVLGIESSCDDTAVGIVSSDGKILSNVVYSQYKVHEKFGGIVPSLAMEAHRGKIDIAVEEAIASSGLPNGIDDIDAIAVTKGPGLEICLRVGLRKAQQLAREHNKPFITIHHLEAHALIARLAGQKLQDPSTLSVPLSCNLSNDTSSQTFAPVIEYPFLVLLVSGGHTSLLLCRNIGDYEFLGGTLDDALGEAFDKAARLLGLPTLTSGGAAVESQAKRFEQVYSQTTRFAHSMTVPMRDRNNFDFSYAGLKNAFRKEVIKAREIHGLNVDNTNAPKGQLEVVTGEDVVTLPDDITSYLCYSFQDIAFKHVEDRLKRALKHLEKNHISINGIVVVGGVASNHELRRRLLDIATLNPLDQPLPIIFPPPSLCTDNGVMVAWCGVEKLQLGISNEIEGQDPIARWPLGKVLKSESLL